MGSTRLGGPGAVALRLLAEISGGCFSGGTVGRRNGMNEMATAHHLVLYTALIVAAMATLEWFESRRARVPGARARGRRGDRTQQR